MNQTLSCPDCRRVSSSCRCHGDRHRCPGDCREIRCGRPKRGVVNQAFLIRDRYVLNAALREPGIANLSTLKDQFDPLQWLAKEIKVEFPDPEFMHITLSGNRPDELLQVV